jgi:flagellar basal-body rod modification protein FlgD
MSTVQGTNTVSPELMAAMNPKKQSTDSVDDAQNRFMTLLVTQMKNQDPLNPMDNAQVTSQFAQLSTVTGINKLNDTFESLKGSYQSSQTLQATGMIGHGVFAPGSDIHLSESQSLFGVEFTTPADSAVVTIKDATGKVVRTMDIGEQEVGTTPLAWDGKMDNDKVAPDGKYTFEIKATRGDTKVTGTNLSFGEVTSVTTGAAGVKLNVPGMGNLNLSDIRQII